MTHLLGLTGSIGMGKSTTATMFREFGVPVWDADATVHKIYAKGGAAVEKVATLFPDAIVDGTISRGALKKLISEDSSVLGQIEAVVHPLVRSDRRAFMDATDAPIIVFDIPLLFETGADSWLDSTLVVTVSPDIQRARVLARPGMSSEQLDVILTRQLPDAEKQARADHIIETLTLDQTSRAVRQLIDKLLGS